MDDEAMVCATGVMRPGRMRIGELAPGVTLPRTVPIVNLFAALGGALFGLIFALIAHPSVNSVVFGIGCGAGGGWLAVTYSPLKNESLLKWLELQFKTTTRSRVIEGRRVTLAIGTAVVPRVPRGELLLLRGSVRVVASQYDERGVLRSASNDNLDSGSGDRLLSASQHRSMAPSSSPSLLGLNDAPTRSTTAPRPAAASASPTAADAPPSRPQRLRD